MAKAPEGYPDWFDQDRHHVGTGGIFETATATLLGPDGQPASAAARAARSETPAPAPKAKRVRKAAAASVAVPDASPAELGAAIDQPAALGAADPE